MADLAWRIVAAVEDHYGSAEADDARAAFEARGIL
jgi:hypothetical protein